MARADLLLGLVRAGSTGDVAAFKETVNALIAEERLKHHHVLADRLEETARVNGRQGTFQSPVSAQPTLASMLHEKRPRRTLDELVLPEAVLTGVRGLVEEQIRADLLRSHGLEPRNRLLLTGPPGTGKTTVAEALAEALVVPMYVVRYEGLIASYLGETASRLHALFEFVSSRNCLVFFDEFDAVGKERGDEHETGEIKRVVSSLLLQMDELPSYVVVVGASNHPELLDRAAWRRFQLRLELPLPSQKDLERLFGLFQSRLGEPLGIPSALLAEKVVGASFAEAEELALDIQRRRVLHREESVETALRVCLGQWAQRAHPIPN